MEKKLIEIMQLYFKAGKELNLEMMYKLYANDFENIRIDKAGQIIRIYKAQFMQRFQFMKAKGLTHGPDDDIEIIGTSFYDNLGSVLVRRNEDGQPALYNFVWRINEGNPKELVREFTVEEDLSKLIALIKSSGDEERS
jgi:hypothetical protein